MYLSEREVWKVKKPVELAFLDFTTVQKRREACEAEVRLNWRLAPDVYLGVVPMRRDTAGRLAVDGDGELVDWAVHMKRLPDRDRADVRLTEARLSDEHIETVAGHIARFHESCDASEKTARFGRPDVIGNNVRENFEQARSTILDYVSPAQVEEIESWQTRFLDERASLFEARIEAGRIRDGHGDLRLEHVYLDESGDVVVIDCIEFNERFRFADVCADVVFLAMDLAHSGRVDLAERFLALYAREANDFDLYPLVDFYESYRAFVRGKIAAMVASDPAAEGAIREKNREDARRYFLLSLASERRALVPPALIAVGGVIASGKSTVAARLGAELAVPVIDADRTRKFLAGVTPKTADAGRAVAGRLLARVHGQSVRRARARRAVGAVIRASRRSGCVLSFGRTPYRGARARRRAACALRVRRVSGGSGGLPGTTRAPRSQIGGERWTPRDLRRVPPKVGAGRRAFAIRARRDRYDEAPRANDGNTPAEAAGLIRPAHALAGCTKSTRGASARHPPG